MVLSDTPGMAYNRCEVCLIHHLWKQLQATLLLLLRGCAFSLSSL